MSKEKNDFSGTRLRVWSLWELSAGSHTKKTMCPFDSASSAGRERDACLYLRHRLYLGLWLAVL